jgi:chemotaxis protein methyltransferase CheR
MKGITQRAYKEVLTDEQFEKLSAFLYTNYGLKMPPTKKLMMEGRLKRRLVSCGIDNFKSYIDFLFSEEGQKQELIHMVDSLTTNKTDFFREDHHFQYLTDVVCPSLTGAKKLSVWSAGCSSGEEPYTISMVLEEAKANGYFDYEIFASDLSYDILKKASAAIYPLDNADIPLDLKRKYFLKSKNIESSTIRVIPDLRKKVTFRRLNFVKTPYPIEGFFDIVFFRNVMIYFDRETQLKVLTEICNKIHKGGYLFIGHSESISSLKLPLRQIQPTIFEKI